jgi:hypothetical protein
MRVIQSKLRSYKNIWKSLALSIMLTKLSWHVKKDGVAAKLTSRDPEFRRADQ